MNNNINLYSILLEVFSSDNNNNNNNKYDYFYKIPFNIENYPISLEQIISRNTRIE